MRQLVRRSLWIVWLLAVPAAQAAAEPPAWAANTSYRVSDRVSFAGVVYEALQAHTSQVGWEPPAVPALWRRAAAPPGTVQDWFPNTFYALRARATFAGVLFETRQAHTSQVGWEPPNVPALWQRPAEDGVVGEWVPQKAYHAGNSVLLEGKRYEALIDHTSLPGQQPPLLPSVWRLASLLSGCAGMPDGSFCLKDWKLEGASVEFGELPTSWCQAQQCVRVYVPDAIYEYPWNVSSPITVQDTGQLKDALATAQADFGHLYKIILEPGTYELDATLTLTRGKVILQGDPLDPDTVRIVHTGTQERRLIRVGELEPANPKDLPLLALNGVTLEGGRAFDGGAGIQAFHAGVIVENSVVRNNISTQFGSGIEVLFGFLYVNKTRIENNGYDTPTLSGCGGGITTTGGGILVSSVDEVYVLNSTISGNYQCRAGGLFSGSSRTYISNSTIAKNRAGSWGAGVAASGPGALSMHFNTIADNEGGKVGSGELKKGAGLALFGFTGRFIMAGNILANNVSGLTPDDFSAFDVPPASGLTFQMRKAWRNNIESWTMAQTPGELGMDATLIGKDPVLGPLQANGQAPDYPGLPTYAPSGADVLQAYSPDPSDPLLLTKIVEKDQRGFVRVLRNLSTPVTTPGSVDPDAVPPPLFIEAESGNPTAPLRIKNAGTDPLAPLASGGAYVEVDPGNNSRNAAPTGGITTLRFTVAKTGSYGIWARVVAPTTSDDSFWVRVDGGSWVQWNDIDPGAGWHWALVRNSLVGNQVLQPSLDKDITHTLEIAYREDGAKLDRLVLTLDGGFTPTGTGP